ncbi:AAA family ATPase [uncultured Sphingomonas sp.]|uniref:AAA family ATPase n=1 Tax=uncultured Sphingomonas sp. TaxID=158754 RepID=UPI0035CB6316
MWRWLDGRPASNILQPEPVDAAAGPIAALPDAADVLPAERRAALVDAFNPSHPIRFRRDLRGRALELDALFEALLHQRQHAIVYGPRGAGKTSLVRVFAHHADRRGVVLIYAASEGKASFVELIRPFLRTVPPANLPVGSDAAYRAELAEMGKVFGPQAVVSLLSRLESRPIIFILDEFDRVTSREVQDQVATLMKLLSDTLSPVQLLVVGIAQSVEGLVDCHPSLRRHVTAVSIGPIPDREVEQLLISGGERAGLAFAPDATALIVEIASGSPYHARLFAYHAGAVALADGAQTVGRRDVVAGLRAAYRRWAGLNREDSALFDRLAEMPATTRAMLAAAVTQVARDDGTESRMSGAASRAALGPMLAPALVHGSDEARPAFRDTTAPQFLLAVLKLPDEPLDRGWAASPAIADATAQLPVTLG